MDERAQMGCMQAVEDMHAVSPLKDIKIPKSSGIRARWILYLTGLEEKTRW
jgi:hypothetical protein